MKTLQLFVLSMSLAASLSAVELGDTYEQVVAEKGAPVAKLEAGQTVILNYADQRIKLKAGKVVELNSKLPAVVRPAEPVEAPPSQVVPNGVWTTDYKAAMAQAKATNGRVFLFFTGSDWCGWCKRLDREVLSTRQFLDYARQNLILVKVDFPHVIVLPAALQAQNDQLAQMYQVDGFPTVVLLDSKGRLAGRLSYQPGGPEPFIAELKK